MTTRNVDVPDYIICKERYATLMADVIASRDARDKATKEHQLLLQKRNTLFKEKNPQIVELQKELKNLENNKRAIIDQYKNRYSFFSFSKQERAEREFANMMKEKVDELDKLSAELDALIRPFDKPIKDADGIRDQANQDYNRIELKARTEIQEIEREAFRKKILDNPVHVQQIVRDISGHLTYAGTSDTRKETCVTEYFVYVSADRIKHSHLDIDAAFSWENQKKYEYVKDEYNDYIRKSINWFQFSDNGVENLQYRQHGAGLLEAIALLVEKHVKQSCTNCKFEYSVLGGTGIDWYTLKIVLTKTNPRYVPLKQW